MEGEKSLKELLEEFIEMQKQEPKEKKNNILKDIPAWGWILGLILGGLVGFFVWLFSKDYLIGGGIGFFVFLICLFVAKSWGMFPPFWARRLGKNKKRKGYVVFMHIGENKAVTFIKAPLDEGVALVNGIPHTVNTDDVLIWKNKIPIVIQPQWSEKPFSPRQHYNETLEKNQESKGWQSIMNYIYKNQIKPDKKKISIGLWIILGIIVIGGAWYLTKGGKLF